MAKRNTPGTISAMISHQDIKRNERKKFLNFKIQVKDKLDYTKSNIYKYTHSLKRDYKSNINL